MSKDDIDKAVKEAEEYAAEDKKRREAVDVRNSADQMVYTTEKTISEFGDKITEDEKKGLEDAKEALKEALKGEDVEAIKAKQEELQKQIYAVSEKVYKAAAEAQQAAQGGADAGAQNAGPDVYDADYTDVDDSNK
jgi:molecular chaperone DnaK